MNPQFRKTVFASAFALALAGIGSAAAADTMSQDVTEARQESQIWTSYALSPYLRANDLKVSVNDGKATLTGTVEDDVNKDLAKQIAMGVKGITDVDNQIVVQADYVPAKRSTTERDFGEVVDDASITSAVKSKLLWSAKTDGLTTDVDTNRGKVRLTGSADTAAEKDLAGRLAANTKGVTSVDNQLVVKPGNRHAYGHDKTKGDNAKDKVKGTANEGKADVADGWITTKVKSTFMYSSNVDGGDITVSTNKGIVTLSGKVDSGAERALAIELAQNVRGVKSVQSKGLVINNVVAGK
jgi:hyperosmotically inducible protein